MEIEQSKQPQAINLQNTTHYLFIYHLDGPYEEY